MIDPKNLKLKDLPLKELKKILDSSKSTTEARNEPIALDIVLEPHADDSLLRAIKTAFLPELPTGRVKLYTLDDYDKSSKPDLALIVTGGSHKEVAACASDYSSRDVACAIVAESAVDAPAMREVQSSKAAVSLVVASDADECVAKLGRWVVDSTDKDLAFAANFPFVRPAKVDQLITTCAVENAAVGAVALIPGADMPIMTVNQAKLALDIAAVYGHDLDAARAPELVGVLGAGFVYRGVARALLGAIPVMGWALKAGMGYAGTKTTGEALRARFELEQKMQNNEDIA